MKRTYLLAVACYLAIPFAVVGGGFAAVYSRNFHLLSALKGALFFGAWTVSYEAIVLLRNLLIHLESIRTGMPVSQIVVQQNASGGMYAFVEGNESMYLVTLIYLFWPIAFNLAAYLRGAAHDA